MAEGQERAAWAAELPPSSTGAGGKAPESQAPKRLASEEKPRRCCRQKQNTPLPHKETKARKTSAVPLFLPRKPGPLKPVM